MALRHTQNGRTEVIEGEGVGFVDALCRGILDHYAREFHSLETIKQSLRVGNDAGQEARCLKALYLLEYDEEESFHRLSQHQALIKLVPHIFPTRWMIHDSGNQLPRLAEFVKRVPVYVFKRRRDLTLLDVQVAAVREHIRSCRD